MTIFEDICFGRCKQKEIIRPKDITDIFTSKMKDLKKEYFIALYLDTKNRVLKDEIISIGTLNSSIVHPREVFKSAIKESANSVILVHNHPSGDPTPSDEDILITANISESGLILGIKLLDHIIIGSEKYWSWKQNYDFTV